MLKIGHRGAMGFEPENTLLSFKKAMDLGADMVELDIHFKDGDLYVLHNIEDWNHQTPMLSQVFDLINRKIKINIELKGDGTAKPAAELIKKYIKIGWDYDDFLISSFKTEELRHFKKFCPQIKFGMLIRRIERDFWETVKELKPFSINIFFDLLNKRKNLFQELKNEGLKIIVWTVNSPKKIKFLNELGVDGIISDYPDRL